MTGEWVSAVWNAVAKDHTQHILATDERFLSHACPVLYGMVVCVSQLDRATKLALQGIIEENGELYYFMYYLFIYFEQVCILACVEWIVDCFLTLGICVVWCGTELSSYGV